MSFEALDRIAAIRSRFGADPAPVAVTTPSASSASTAAFGQAMSRASSTAAALGLGTAGSSGSGSSSATAWPSTAASLAARTASGRSTGGPSTASAGDPVLTDATPYAELFRAAGATYGVDPSLLAAVAKVESGFNPGATSSAGAEGLMQFMPGTSSGMGVDPWDPASAIDGAARLLASHRDRFGSTELALAAYNAGPGNVQKYGGVPPFAETQAYVAKVLALAPGAA